MGEKRNKILKGPHFVPEVIDFSKLDPKATLEHSGREIQFDVGDDGLQMESIEKSVEFEELIVQMLYNLDGNERIIFLYQLLRDFGYQIDHGSFAKTLKINRQRYMDILGNVRIKTYLMVQGHKVIGGNHSNGQKQMIVR